MAYLVWFCSFRSKSSPSVFCRILHLCFVGLQFFRHCYLGSHFISRLVFAYVFTRKCRFCAHIYHQKTARSRKEKWPPTACNFAHTTPHRATEIHPRSSSLGKLSHTLFPISFASCHITSRCASSSLCYQSSSCAAFLSRGTSTSTGVRRMSRCSNTASSREENFSREPACVVTWRSLAPRGASNQGRGGRDHAPDPAVRWLRKRRRGVGDGGSHAPLSEGRCGLRRHRRGGWAVHGPALHRKKLLWGAPW